MNGLIFIIFGTLGGLSFFIQGMQMTSDGLQKVAGSTLKGALKSVTDNRILGVIMGILVTVLIQSSSATTVMLVSFTSAGLMALRQTIGVILGADIGTTLTVQLIAFKVSDFALLMVAIGFLLKFTAKKQRKKYLGEIIMGFGMIFFGMSLMSKSVEPLRGFPAFCNALVTFGANPVLGVLISALFTGIIQSSAATIGLALSFSMQGLIGIEAAVPLIFGANIGTCVTALLSSIGSTTEGKRVAVAHILFKIFGVMVFIPILPVFINIVKMTSSVPTRQIANAHSLFNIGITLLFLPFTTYFASLVTRLVPEKKGSGEPYAPLHLERKLLATPVLALEASEREIQRVSMMVRDMVAESVLLFNVKSEEEIREFYQREVGVDRISREIVEYLTDMSQGSLSEEESQLVIKELMIINDLELIGDVVANISHFARKKFRNELSFSAEGKTEINRFHERVSLIVEKITSAIVEKDKSKAENCLNEFKELTPIARALRGSHMQRLCSGITQSKATTAIHLDVIHSLEQIADIAVNLAHTIIGEDSLEYNTELKDFLAFGSFKSYDTNKNKI